jgi:hypothetical protein
MTSHVESFRFSMDTGPPSGFSGRQRSPATQTAGVPATQLCLGQALVPPALFLFGVLCGCWSAVFSLVSWLMLNVNKSSPVKNTRLPSSCLDRLTQPPFPSATLFVVYGGKRLPIRRVIHALLVVSLNRPVSSLGVLNQVLRYGLINRDLTSTQPPSFLPATDNWVARDRSISSEPPSVPYHRPV